MTQRERAAVRKAAKALSVLLHEGSQDIYTDAWEFRPHVNRMLKAIRKGHIALGDLWNSGALGR